MTPQKKKEFFSIPNLLCYVRILLLPIFIVLFVLERDGWTAAVLLLSAATDVVDGFIARKFHMETELGKFLDPLADKLTQAVVSGCLLIRYPIMWVLFLIILVKESFQAVGGLLMYRRMKSIRSSEWFGKLSTVCFYTVMAYLVIFAPEPSFLASTLPIIVSTGLMLFALIRYAHRFVQMVSQEKAAGQAASVE